MCILFEIKFRTTNMPQDGEEDLLKAEVEEKIAGIEERLQRLAHAQNTLQGQLGSYFLLEGHLR